jgi:hypothetical protein
VIDFTATDDTAVTGYLVTMSSLTPLASNPNWESSATTTYHLTSSGTTTLYAWAKDAADNVSSAATSSVFAVLTAYTVGGSVSGLSGTLVLRNNGGDNLSISANGAFVFATAVLDGNNYSVTVLVIPLLRLVRFLLVQA